ncbi:MAG: paraquat-inducible protein A [Chthoniobacteraceae bacterium]
MSRSAHAPPSQFLACHDCDALFDCRPLEEGETVICPRCQAKLHSCRKNSVQRSTALGMSAAVLFIVANLYPFLTLEVGGQLSEITLSESVSKLNAHGSPWLAAGVAIFIIGAPSLMLAGMLFLLLPLLSGRRLPGALTICRWVYGTDPWNMIEVFLIGVLVSLLKLGDIAKVTLGTSFWAFAGVIICLTASLGSIDRRELWDRLEVAGK